MEDRKLQLAFIDKSGKVHPLDRLPVKNRPRVLNESLKILQRACHNRENNDRT